MRQPSLFKQGVIRWGVRSMANQSVRARSPHTPRTVVRIRRTPARYAPNPEKGALGAIRRIWRNSINGCGLIVERDAMFKKDIRARKVAQGLKQEKSP